MIATGKQYSVREFIERAVAVMGITIAWEGSDLTEVGRVVESTENDGPQPGDVIVRIDPRYFRPTEVESLWGDASKAKKQLGWEPNFSFDELIEEMVLEDLAIAKRDAIVAREGFKTFNHHE